jgi:hypothetical protein
VIPTATPFSAAAFRLTMAADPVAPQRGEVVTFSIRLANQSPFGVALLLVEVVPPLGAQIDALSPVTGSAGRDGAVVRWLIDELAAGASTRLTVRATMLQDAAPLELCATLLSAGAPVEQCLSLEPESGVRVGIVQRGGSVDPAAAGQAQTAAPPEPPSAASARGNSSRVWPLLAIGLGLLGLWLGGALRSRSSTAQRGTRDLPVDLGEGGGVGSEVEAARVTGDDLEE